MKTIIIHGHQNEGFRISQDSIDRCFKALEFFKTVKAERIICTGGLFDSHQLGIRNSHAFKVWLVARVLPADVILEENESITTIDNVLKTVCLLKPEDIVYVITSNYHCLRTKLIWKLIGKRKIILLSAKSKITFQKIFSELIGIIVVFCWSFGFRFPELYFRKKERSIAN